MKPKHAKKSFSLVQELRRIVRVIWEEMTRKQNEFDKAEEEAGL